jgi:hypothetical protein
VLILRTRNVRNYARRVAEVNHLSFLAAQQQLTEQAENRDGAFDSLHVSLDRDYRVVSYLLRHTGTQNSQTIVEHMLRLDYQVMRACYFLAKPFSPSSARQALIERASIIGHLANAMGERVTLS